MSFGSIIIDLTFLSAVASAVAFFRYGKNAATARSAMLLYRMTVAGIIICTGLLFGIILMHQFQYTYVAQYSSMSQPLLYQISAFWAGQEGTFLLWTLFVSVMGVVFLRKSNPLDSFAMGIVSVYIGFLALLMIVKSPFNVSANAPADGSGMNPLLQNFWMVIHPPVLFVGYAAAVFPFALAISALKRRQYVQWHSSGFSWTLFAATMLGAGIIIGGFWAYEVLGWGGYWGWDPVENSSLVPWLTLLALVHGFLIQKNKGAMVRTNLFFAIISFLLVLYATFLTRSGVLQDFSVHSFQDFGIGNYLIGIIAAGFVVSLGLFVTRFRELKSPKINISGLNREVMVLLSLYALSAAALFTFFGMSSPIFTGLWGKASQVDVSFYNKVNFPVAIAIALLLGVTPFLGWSGENKASLLKKLSVPLLLTVLAGVIAYVGGVTSPALLLFVGSASFGLISNAIIAVRQYRAGFWNLGGPLAHIGVGLLLVGIIGSGSFDETTRVVLQQGQTGGAFGYQFTFEGMRDQTEMKPQIQIGVTDGKTSYVAFPKLYFSEYNKAMMREPDIRIFPLKDLYISPVEMKVPEPQNEQPTLAITKGETVPVGNYQVTFARFDVGQHGQPGPMSVGAVLEIAHAGKTEEYTPRLVFEQNGERKLVPVSLRRNPDDLADTSNMSMVLTRISVEEKKIYLEVQGISEHAAAMSLPQVILEISVKPLMMVVWTGVVFIMAGSVIAFRRRTRGREGDITTMT